MISAEDNFREVYLEAMGVNFCYYQFGVYLGLPQRELEAIRTAFSTNINQAFIEVLLVWLKRRYSAEKYGPPTWRKLVEAVDNPAAGNNHALAKTIAEHHPMGGPSGPNNVPTFTGVPQDKHGISTRVHYATIRYQLIIIIERLHVHFTSAWQIQTQSLAL